MNNNCQKCNSSSLSLSTEELILLNRIPVLRFLKDPAENIDELYDRFPDGLSYGSFALISPIEGSSYFVEWKEETNTWEPITGDIEMIINQFSPILDTDFFNEIL